MMMMPQPGILLPPPVVEQLKLTPEQREKLDKLQKETTTNLEKILTEEQRKRLKEMGEGMRGGFGGPGGPKI